MEYLFPKCFKCYIDNPKYIDLNIILKKDYDFPKKRKEFCDYHNIMNQVEYEILKKSNKKFKLYDDYTVHPTQSKLYDNYTVHPTFNNFHNFEKVVNYFVKKHIITKLHYCCGNKGLVFTLVKN
tara:strand:- start:381 stop:752 length:372 start_codon:yes stop_codon:yes gene_type:complete